VSRWVALIPLIVLIALGALFGLFALKRASPEFQPQAMVGKPLPNLSLPTLAEGQPKSLKELASEGPMLVNFFASWCAPCEIEHPVLMTLKAEKVRVVGVAYKDKLPQTQAFLTRLGDPFAEILVDQDGRAGIEFGLTGVPETYLVSREGVIVAKHVGPLNEREAKALAARLK
jgi:cytochrome c biogenesis protein CcmG, thiol:disulfide interchange protein DsbE